jgi:hypothetical protein
MPLPHHTLGGVTSTSFPAESQLIQDNVNGILLRPGAGVKANQGVGGKGVGGGGGCTTRDTTRRRERGGGSADFARKVSWSFFLFQRILMGEIISSANVWRGRPSICKHAQPPFGLPIHRCTCRVKPSHRLGALLSLLALSVETILARDMLCAKGQDN